MEDWGEEIFAEGVGVKWKNERVKNLITIKYLITIQDGGIEKTAALQATTTTTTVNKKRSNFADLTMKNNSFTCLARAFFLFLDISLTFSFFPRREMTCFAVVWTT